MIKLVQGFDVCSPLPIDGRILLTRKEMNEIDDNIMPNRYFAICKDDGKIYLYDKNNVISPYGRFRMADDDINERITEEVETLNEEITESVNDLNSRITEEVDSLNEKDVELDSKIDQTAASLTEDLELAYNQLDDKIDSEVNTLNDTIVELESTLNDKIDNVEESLNTEIGNVEELLSARIEDIDTSLNDKINDVEANLDDYKLEAEEKFIDASELVDALEPYSLIVNTGSKVKINFDEATYKFSVTLMDVDENNLSTSNEIDLPLESVVIDGRYDNDRKEIILTLKNGNEINFSIADLVNGLVSQDDFDEYVTMFDEHVDDSDVHVNLDEKSTWNAKYDLPDNGIPMDDLSQSVNDLLDAASTAVQPDALDDYYTKDETYSKEDLYTKDEVDNTISEVNEKVDDLESKVDTKTNLIAGENVSISESSEGTIINAVDTTYTAGEGVNIIDNVISTQSAAPTWEAIKGDNPLANDALSSIVTPINESINTLNELVDGGSTGGLVSEVERVEQSLDDHIDNLNIHVTTTDKENWNNKYTKPNGGIPSTDMDASTRGLLEKINPLDEKVFGTDGLVDKVDYLIAEGGEPNVIETVEVNGTPLIPSSSKAVNIEVPEKVSELTNDGDGTQGSKFATEEYVNDNGGKIDNIYLDTSATPSVKPLPIESDKSVRIDISDYALNSDVSTTITNALANGNDPYQTKSDVNTLIENATANIPIVQESSVNGEIIIDNEGVVVYALPSSLDPSVVTGQNPYIAGNNVSIDDSIQYVGKKVINVNTGALNINIPTSGWEPDGQLANMYKNILTTDDPEAILYKISANSNPIIAVDASTIQSSTDLQKLTSNWSKIYRIDAENHGLTAYASWESGSAIDDNVPILVKFYN